MDELITSIVTSLNDLNFFKNNLIVENENKISANEEDSFPDLKNDEMSKGDNLGDIPGQKFMLVPAKK